MNTRLIQGLLIGMITLSSDGFVSSAQASVEGNSYNVTVFTPFTATFTDTLTFETGGHLTAATGAMGQWTETPHGPFSNWSGNLSTIQLSGWQIGPTLFGTGGDNLGHRYLLVGLQAPAP